MQTPMNFDPMTGEQINKDGNNKNTKKTGLIIGIVAAACAVIIGAGIGIYFIVLGNGLSQVSMAVINTAKEFTENNLLYQTLDIKDIVDDKEYSIDAEIETEVPMIGDIYVEADVAVVPDYIQTNGNIDLSYIPPLQYTMQLDDTYLKAKTPFLEDYLFVYDYTKINDNSLMDNLDQDTINATLSQMYTMVFKSDFNDDVSDEINDLLKKELGKNKFSHVKSADYTIDGRQVKCKGYKVTLMADSINNILDGVNAIMQENYKDAISMSAYDLEEISREIKEMGNIDVTFYIYQKELADIQLETENGDMAELIFEGGSYRAQNIELIENDEQIFAINGSTENGVEKNLLRVEDKDIVSYVYDTAKKDLTLTIYGENDSYNVNMDIERSKSELFIDLDYFDFGDTYIGGSLKIRDGASVEPIDGKEFNIGTASEEDINDLIEIIYDKVRGLIGW